jgi:DNA-binding XRE family transcriptional regulator
MQERRLSGRTEKLDRVDQRAAAPSERRRLLMGNPRPKPLRLAEKLLQIRKGLELSQTQMLARMGLEETMHYGRISEYEQGKREPTLMTLLAYARAASVHLEDIVDDDLELPRKLPGNLNYRGLARKSTRRK